MEQPIVPVVATTRPLWPARLLLRAPEAAEDFLDQEQVARYLATLSEEDRLFLAAATFLERARLLWPSQDVPLAADATLAKAVLACLEGVPALRRSLQLEFEGNKEALGHVVAAFGSSPSRRCLAAGDALAALVTFSVAYRIYCYFASALAAPEALDAIDKPEVVFVLGVPGAGKGTQCALLAGSMFGFEHISIGDLLREECRLDDSVNREGILDCFKRHQLVPSGIVLALLAPVLKRGGKYLVDGFPRSVENLQAFEQTLGRVVLLRFVLYLECSSDTSRQRLHNRKTPQSPPEQLAADVSRLQIFEEEAPAVLDEFLARGLLRKVNAEQNVDEVCMCVQEIFHLEIDEHLTNHAVVLIKPHAMNAETQRFVQSYLVSRGIAVVRRGTVTAAELAERGLFDKQYFDIMGKAVAEPETLQMPPSALDRFKVAFGISWHDALAGGFVLSAQNALDLLSKTPQTLLQVADDTVRVAHSLHISRVLRSDAPTVFVVNAFALHWRETFAAHGALTWLQVTFSPARLSWRQFRADVLGATDPAKAAPGSIRGLLYEHWQLLGLPAQPNILDNGVHFSAGPVEGLREIILWGGGELHDHRLGRSLLVLGVPEAHLQAWLENPRVRDWAIGHHNSSGPLFDCTQDCNHSVLRESAARYICNLEGRLTPWCMGVANSRRMGTSKCRQTSRGLPPAGSGQEEGVDGTPKASVMTILHFNDVYNVEPRKKEPVGGIARFVTRVRELKQEAVSRGEPEAMCLFSGDAFNPSLTSTVTKGRHMVPALNAVGIDVACYGNHDFDFGEDQLGEMAAETNFPWLISNVTMKDTGSTLGSGLKTLITDWHGRKIGFMGLIEYEWLVTLHTIEPNDVIFEDFCTCARTLAKALRDGGAELVIALTHMRAPNDELLAREVLELDLILGGHDHHYDVKPVGPHGTYVLKSGTDFRDITVLRLRFTEGDEGSRGFEVLDTSHVQVDSSVAEDPDMKTLVDECGARVGGAMDQFIGYTAVDLDSRFSTIRTRESNVGNFVADVMRDGLRTDVALVNSGTLRADAILDTGALRMRDLLSLLPMLDELCVLRLTGADLLRILENGVSQYPRLEGRFLQVSGVSFAFDAAKPGGQRIDVASVCVGQAPLDPVASYTVCTLDFLRHGKDGFDAFKTAECLFDGEQAGILPTIVRNHFTSLGALDGEEANVAPHRVRQANRLVSKNISRCGDGPEPMRHFGIHPVVEGRVVCINPVEVAS